MRRYDIDWIRVIAIGLLLIYHVAIGFQPWGIMIGFPTSKESWVALWTPMAALNVWRIPLLFFVSGMGVYFGMQQRNWTQLIKERTLRIWLPFIFGMFFIVPLHVFLWQYHYKMKLQYQFDPGHLWFLANIFIYVLVLCPLFYWFKRNENGRVMNVVRTMFNNPLSLIVVVGAFIAEALIIKPNLYEMYAMTRHGFFLGLFAFFFGFCFVLIGAGFWQMLQRWRWFFIVLAVVGFGFRQFHFGMNTPIYLLVIESQCWIFAVLAFGSKHLNKSSRVLTYLSQAAYPVYIVHMVFLFLGSLLIFPLLIPVQLKFVFVLLFTMAGCFLMFEGIRRIKYLRPLFGLKM